MQFSGAQLHSATFRVDSDLAVCPAVADGAECWRNQIIEQFEGGCAGEIRTQEQTAEFGLVSIFECRLDSFAQPGAISWAAAIELGEAQEPGLDKLKMMLADEFHESVKR